MVSGDFRSAVQWPFALLNCTFWECTEEPHKCNCFPFHQRGSRERYRSLSGTVNGKEAPFILKNFFYLNPRRSCGKSGLQSASRFSSKQARYLLNCNCHCPSSVFSFHSQLPIVYHLYPFWPEEDNARTTDYLR